MDAKSGLILLIAAGFILLVTISSYTQHTPDDIKAFVRTDYEHGIPYDQSVKFDKTVVPTLLEMLKDPREQNWWGNIIATLGVIGDARAVNPLISFLERDVRGEVDPRLLSALLSVPTALGHIAAKGNDQAIDYLIANSRSATLRAKKIPWKFGALSGDQLQMPLMKASILGLGISAQPRAMQALEQMQAAPDTEATKQTVSEALNLAAEIKSKSRMQVFSKHP